MILDRWENVINKEDGKRKQLSNWKLRIVLFETKLFFKVPEFSLKMTSTSDGQNITK